VNAELRYPYASGELLEERNTYFYSRYHGSAFLAAWRQQRDAAAGSPNLGSSAPSDDSPTAVLLESLWLSLQDAGNAESFAKLDRLLQRFEVSKRVHGAYGDNWRPLDPDDYRCMGRYLRLAELLELAWTQRNALPYLNGLLKLLDTLCALQGRLDIEQQARLRRLIVSERQHVSALQRRLEGAARAA